MAQFLQPHQQLAGYEVLDLIGKGGMGEVYRARQLSMDRMVALKVMNVRQARQDPSFAKNFVQEARAAGRLSNPNIISVHDVGSATLPGSPEEVYYFSMELIEGETLKDVIKREGVCSEKLTALVMNGMAEALIYAEKVGIVHRDIKPDNIMISTSNLVKLADLGLALQVGGEEVVDENDPQARSKVMGTPMYMSPEQARALKLDHRSDQYSLGATLFHMLTGQPPYRGADPKAVMRAHVFDPVPDPHELKPEVPEAWRQLCMKLMAKLPDERFATAADLKAAVLGAVHGHTLASLSKRMPRLNRRTGSLLPLWAQLLGVVAVVCVAAAAMFMIDWRKHAPTDATTDPAPDSDPKVTKGDVEDAPLKIILGALPTDPAKALAAMQKLAGDPAWQSPHAKTLLAAEVKRRQATLDGDRKEAFKRQLDGIDRRIADKDLAGAKDALAALASAQPESTAQPPFKQVNDRLTAALTEMANGFRSRLDKAGSGAEIDAIAAEARNAPLSGDDASSVQAEAAKRRADLTTVAAAQASAAERQAWDALALALDEKRRGLKYNEIQTVIELRSSQFPKSAQAMLTAMGDLGLTASAGEQLLKRQIEGKRQLDLRIDDKPVKAQIQKWGLTEVQYLAADANGEVRKAERGKVALPYREILDQIQAKDANFPSIRAVSLWMWRSPDARAALDQLGADPLALGLKQVDRCLSGGLDVTGSASRQGELVTIDYDFSGKDPRMLDDFVGDKLAFGEHGLAWTTKKNVAKGTTTENDLPRIAWKAAMAAPFTVRAKLWVHPRTILGMVGVESGGRRVRMVFASGGMAEPEVHSLNQRLGVAFTAPDGARFLTKEKAYASRRAQLWDPAEPLGVELTVTEDGHVDAACKGELIVPSPAAVLPIGAPFTVVLQAYQFNDNETTIEIEDLEIVGKPLPR